ncbi:MAG: DUF3866 family protein [Actinomycetota bacterium]
MAFFATGKVTKIEERPGIVALEVDVDERSLSAYGFPLMLGPVEPGDAVIVNTTGIDLGLGTGGVGFVLWNLDGPGPPRRAEGHIVKLRYTPWQTNVLAAEEPLSPHHGSLAGVDSIGPLPVVACGLHSQVAAAAAGVKAAHPEARVGYLMSDGGALPLAWSGLVRRLRAASLLDVTCTYGHAFGGDLEAVNVFSGLASLHVAGRVDVAIVGLGPGVAGTATTLGFSAIEQGQALDAVSALGGRSIACLRISFADPRARHRGVSHHSLTSLRIAARERSTVVVPLLPAEQSAVLRGQLREAGIDDRHNVVVADGAPGLALLRATGVHPTSMGRSLEQTPELFLAGAAAGRVAADRLPSPAS